MKKRDLATLALLGISAGLLVGSCGHKQKENKAEAAEQVSSDIKGFYNALSPESQKKFNELDERHQMMAVEMTTQQGMSQNSCAGMGGCATSAHACAGQNACKGQGGPAIQDPNRAVEIQYRNQMTQRTKMSNQMGTQQTNGSVKH